MNIIRQEIRTGLLVVVSLAVLTMVMLYIGAPGVFIPENTFYVYVDNAAGLKQGADVTLAGRKIGQVTRLTSPVPEAERPLPDNETLIEVKVRRTSKVYNHVKVSLTQNGLLGEYLLDFTSGAESSGLAKDGSRFLGERPAGLDQAVPMVLAKLDPALKKATETLDSLQKTADNLTKLTSPQGEIPQMLEEFHKVGANLDSISAKEGPLRLALENVASLTGPDGKIQAAVGNIEVLTASTGSLSKALQNAEKFTSDLATNKDLKLTLENSRRATSELDTTMSELRAKFSAIAANLQQATDTVKRQPWRLVWPNTKKYPDDTAATPVPKASREQSRRRSAR